MTMIPDERTHTTGTLRAFLAPFAVALALVVALNVTVDAGGLENQDAMVALARSQGPGDLVVADQLGYQRAWVKTRLLEPRDTRGGASCPDILFLGSSTIGGHAQEMYERATVLNGWMGGPTIEDFEAMANVLQRAPCWPKTIVVGVDPWWVANGEVDDQRWQAVKDEFLGYQRSDSALTYGFFAAKLEWNRVKERLNFTTTRESARLLGERMRHGAAPQSASARVVRLTPDDVCPRMDELGAKHVRSFDGHYTDCPQFHYAPAELERLATHWLSDNSHRMAEWNDVDSARVARLVRVLDQWKTHARVVLVGNPYHPSTYRILRDDPTVGLQLLRLDAMLDAIAKARGTVFVNLRDPAKVGCSAPEFEDADHGTPECVRKVAAELRRAAGL